MNSTSNQSENINVHYVSPDWVDPYWPLVGPILQMAIDEASGEFDLDDVYRLVTEGKMQLLVIVEDLQILAAAVTEVVYYPKKISLRVVLAAGVEAKKWCLPLLEMARQGARAIGASSVETFGRKGWAKLFQDVPSVKLKYHVLVEDI